MTTLTLMVLKYFSFFPPRFLFPKCLDQCSQGKQYALLPVCMPFKFCLDATDFFMFLPTILKAKTNTITPGKTLTSFIFIIFDRQILPEFVS